MHKVVLYASNHGYVHPNETDFEPCQSAGFLLFRGGGQAMQQPGQHEHSLFPGINNSNPKTFVLEVDGYRVEDALAAMEKAIRELKLCQRHFGQGNEMGVRAIIRYS